MSTLDRLGVALGRVVGILRRRRASLNRDEFAAGYRAGHRAGVRAGRAS